MIISHKHKFIFLHVPRTGGTSISISLMRYLGSNDICIGGIPGAVKRGIYPPLSKDARSLFVFAKNIIRTRSIGRSLAYTNKRHYMKLGLEGHSTWQAVKDYIGEDKWNSYYKFAFDRNPYDKMVSIYFWWKNRFGGTQTFKDFLVGFEKSKNIFYSDDYIVPAEREPKVIYTDASREIQVEDVGRFENMQEELGRFLHRVGIEWDGWLPIAKPGKRNRDYRGYYDDESSAIVRRMFGWEIEHFGYEY